MQMSIQVPTELGEQIEEVVESHEEMTESRFAREAMRRELQRYEQKDYNNE